ncbi:MAG: putative glycosyl transferase [Bacteroidetes bacterium]|nr:putative glycosyl transferase [Bacteroidota bacterium]
MADRMKILVIDNLAVESSRRSVYRLLAQRPEFEIHLLVPRRWKETADEIVCEDEPLLSLHLHISHIFFGYRHHRVLYSDLFRVLRKVKPDFVLAVHAPENYATFQLLAARKLLRPSMKIGLFASRNIDLPSVGFPYKLSFLNSICDWVTARSKVDVAYHRPEGFGHLYRRYTERTVYIPHSVDCSMFDASSNRSQGDVTLGYVGRLTEEKGVHILIEALSRLQANVRLVIVGDGPHRLQLRMLANRLGITDRVTFEHPVRYSEMPRLLNRLDVLVLPSLETAHWKELFGRILIEAMACGVPVVAIEAMACEVPVVASASGGIPEVVGDAGLLFETGNVSNLVEKLHWLVQDLSRRQALGRMGRERVMKLFDTRLIAEMLAKDFAAVLRA